MLTVSGVDIPMLDHLPSHLVSIDAIIVCKRFNRPHGEATFSLLQKTKLLPVFETAYGFLGPDVSENEKNKLTSNSYGMPQDCRTTQYNVISNNFCMILQRKHYTNTVCSESRCTLRSVGCDI
jgi:hypothetical protein